MENLRWLPYENINLNLGIDDLSFFFVILTTFLIPICILVGWSGMRSYGKEYITASLIREFLMIAVFCMLDPLLFYVLPESVGFPNSFVNKNSRARSASSCFLLLWVSVAEMNERDERAIFKSIDR